MSMTAPQTQPLGNLYFVTQMMILSYDTLCEEEDTEAKAL